MTYLNLKAMCFILIFPLLYSGILFSQPGEKELRKEATKYANVAKRYHKQGQYKNSAEYAVVALKGPLKKRKKEKTLEIFKESFDQLVAQKKTRVDMLLKNSEGYNGQSTVYSRAGLVKEYDILQGFMDTIRSLDNNILNEAGIDQRQLVNYEDELVEAKENYDSAMVVYTDDSYLRGKEEMAINSKTGYRKAYRLFNEIEQLRAGYKDADSLRSIAKDKGTYRMVLGLMENRTGKSYDGNLEYVIAAQVSMELGKLNISLLEMLPLDAGLVGNGGSLSSASSAKAFAQQSEADIVLFGTFYDFSHSVGKPIVRKTDHSNEVPDGPKKWRVNADGKKVKYQPMKTVYATTNNIKKGQQAGVKMSLFVYNNETDNYEASNTSVEGTASYSIEYNDVINGDTKAIALYSKDWYPDVPPSLLSESEMLRLCLENAIPGFIEASKKVLTNVE